MANATESLLLAAHACSERPADGQPEEAFWETLAWLDVLLRVRENLRS